MGYRGIFVWYAFYSVLLKEGLGKEGRVTLIQPVEEMCKSDGEIIDIAYIKKHGWVVFEAICGSRSFGLHHEKSDTDIHGVFIVPPELRPSLVEGWTGSSLKQVESASKDHVYWEIGRFLELLTAANPNALELLHSPEDCVLYRDDRVMGLISKEDYVTDRCYNTFGQYAVKQIHRACSLNKKALEPVPLERKSVLDFCYVTEDSRSVPVTEWLSSHKFQERNCALSCIDKMPGLYALYHQVGWAQRLLHFHIWSRGIASATGTDVVLSSVPKGVQPLAYLQWNKDAYSVYCRRYREYWDWVARRNEERYQAVREHGKNYDAKNMGHVFRLLHMSYDLACGNGIRVRRTEDREFLLKVKSGHWGYGELLEMAKDKIQGIQTLREEGNSSLPSSPPEIPPVLTATIQARYPRG